MAERRRVARRAGLLAVVGAWAFASIGCGESGGAFSEDGWRVDDRDRADDCVVDEQVFCTGSGFPLVRVDVARERIVVAWIGSYEPGRDEAYVRELERSGRPLGEPRSLGPVRDPGAHMRIGRSGAGYTLSWDRRIRTYSPEFRLLRTRRGTLRLGRDPHVREGRYGSPLAQLPGGARVLVHRTMRWQIRAIPQR